MPIKPSVFRPIRSHDVHQRPFKAFKRYILRDVSPHNGAAGGTAPEIITLGTGYVTQSAVYSGLRQDVRDETDPRKITYLINDDLTNQHVIWKSLKHRFYTDGGNNFPEHSLNHRTERKLFYSASTLSLPYFDVGERIKPGSSFVSASFAVAVAGQKFAVSESPTIILNDDGQGNLRDKAVSTSSFASSSRNILYLTFNDKYTSFKHPYGGRFGNKAISYIKKENVHNCLSSQDIILNRGPVTKWKREWGGQPAGLSGWFTSSNSYIRLAHDPMFDSFGRCDDWTISFWIRRGSDNHDLRPILSKAGVVRQETFNQHSTQGRSSALVSTAGISNVPMPDGDWSKFRTPFMIGVQTHEGTGSIYHFQASDGARALHLTAFSPSVSGSDTIFNPDSWDHVVVRNSASLCQFFINGHVTGSSGSLPGESTANRADVMLGSYYTSDYQPAIPQPMKGSISIQSGHHYQYGTTVIDNGTITIKDGASLTVFGTLQITGSGFLEVLQGGTIEAYGFVDVDETTSTVLGEMRVHGEYEPNDYALSEFRMYDYAVENEAITTLANNDFESGSLFQTNVAGNVFYRNGQFVVSSPMPKFQTGSGFFSNDNFWTCSWRGSHKIYENQVFVRVPKDVCNVSVNPTATYKPTTVGGTPCGKYERGAQPGEFRKSMFVSGTALPYVTTIGLYNDQHQMLAVGKMAQPVQKRDDVDMNFVIRWDY